MKNRYDQETHTLAPGGGVVVIKSTRFQKFIYNITQGLVIVHGYIGTCHRCNHTIKRKKMIGFIFHTDQAHYFYHSLIPTKCKNCGLNHWNYMVALSAFNVTDEFLKMKVQP